MPKPLAVRVWGASGRVGSEVLALLKADERYQLVESELDSPDDQTQIVIDFSVPEGTATATAYAVAKGVPLVTGVTGLDQSQRALIEHSAESIPVLADANMSTAVHSMAKQVATVLKDHATSVKAVQLTETHRLDKRDKPSGTALLIQQYIADIAGQQIADAVEIISKREGDIFGIHEVKIRLQDEELYYCHNAQSRQCFAQGAIRAASWLVEQDLGLYSMKSLFSSDA